MTYLRKCIHCGTKAKTENDLISFVTDNTCRYNKTNKCKPCDAKIHRENNLEKKYGLSLEEYDNLLERQEGKCAICGTTENRGPGFRLVVDHNHDTGKVRGLLCNGCNTGIGNLYDNPKVVLKAYEYLITNGHYGKDD